MRPREGCSGELVAAGAMERKVKGRTDNTGSTSIDRPINALVTKDDTPDFSWGSVVYGNQYEIQISVSSTFVSVLQSSTRDPGVITYPADALPEGKYYWRVRAINTSSARGPWSTVRSFIRR